MKRVAIYLRVKEMYDQHNEAMRRDAGAWKALIVQGARGDRLRGVKSAGEVMVTQLAGTVLPCGMPALAFLNRCSNAEIDQIRVAMRELDLSGWYYPLLRRQPSEQEATGVKP
jgi:hypothetical protein